MCRISAFSDSSVEDSFRAVVERHLIKPRFTVNGWCESNLRKRSVAVGFLWTFDVKPPSGVLLIKQSRNGSCCSSSSSFAKIMLSHCWLSHLPGVSHHGMVHGMV